MNMDMGIGGGGVGAGREWRTCLGVEWGCVGMGRVVRE